MGMKMTNIPKGATRVRDRGTYLWIRSGDMWQRLADGQRLTETQLIAHYGPVREQR